MALPLESRSQGTPIMEKKLITRATSANLKGKGFQFTAGYSGAWKPMAKRLQAEGKLDIRGGRIYVKGVKKEATPAKAPKAPKAPKTAKTETATA